MKSGVLLGVASLAGLTVVLGQLNADTSDDAPASFNNGAVGDTAEAGGQVGPDVIVGDLTGPRYWTQNGTEVAYSIGTTSCNLGDTPLEWIDEGGSNHHPVIGQNMFKITGSGRLLHIGQSWLKHGFCALQGTICGSCDSFCGGCCDHLGPGCSDPYSASRNGGQSGLGPKWEVDPHTGVFPIPWDQGEGTAGEYLRRLRVKISDLDTSTDVGAQFMMEGQYVTQDDALWNNQNNNASYRRVAVNQTGIYSVSFVGGTQREKPAIQGWADLVADVELVDVQADGLFTIGTRVVDTGEGDWIYEYVLYNLNSDRAASCFEVPVPAGAKVVDMGFHNVDYHSGEVWDNTDWAVERTATGVSWSNGTTYEAQPEANALRWGTAYTLWFRTDVSPSEPGEGSASMCLFKPSDGEPDSVEIALRSPQASCTPSAGDTNGDGTVDVEDLLTVLGEWGCTGLCAGDTNCDGVVNVSDLLEVTGNWTV